MTLNEIADDILLTCVYINREKAVIINRRQVYSWIHMYRTMLIKQDINDNSVIDPTYVSTMEFLMVADPNIEISLTCMVFESKEDIPKLPTLTGRFAIIAINDLAGDYISFGDELHSKFTGSNVMMQDFKQAYVYGNKLRMRWYHSYDVQFFDYPLIVKLILANPEDAVVDINEFPYVADREYPLPDDKVNRIKQLIFANELQWLLPPQGTSQSSQQAKMEEKETSNNPLDMMRMGGQMYEGID